MPRVVDYERKHAVQMHQTINSPLKIRREDDFRIAVRTERMSTTSEVPLQLAVVIDLAVENNDHGSSGVYHRLVARRRKIHYREAAMP